MPLHDRGEHSKNALHVLWTTSKPSDLKPGGRGSTGRSPIVRRLVIPSANSTGNSRYAKTANPSDPDSTTNRASTCVLKKPHSLWSQRSIQPSGDLAMQSLTLHISITWAEVAEVDHPAGTPVRFGKYPTSAALQIFKRMPPLQQRKLDPAAPHLREV